jgi:hypothetical protein
MRYRIPVFNPRPFFSPDSRFDSATRRHIEHWAETSAAESNKVQVNKRRNIRFIGIDLKQMYE